MDAVLSLTRGEGAEFVLDCTGSPAAIAGAPAFARKGGKIVLVGSPRGEFNADFTEFLNAFHLDRSHGDLTLQGAHEWKIPLMRHPAVKHSQVRNIELIAGLMETGQLKLAQLLTDVFTPGEAPKSIRTAANGGARDAGRGIRLEERSSKELTTMKIGYGTYGMQTENPFEALPRLRKIGYDMVEFNGRSGLARRAGRAFGRRP